VRGGGGDWLTLLPGNPALSLPTEGGGGQQRSGCRPGHPDAPQCRSLAPGRADHVSLCASYASGTQLARGEPSPPTAVPPHRPAVSDGAAAFLKKHKRLNILVNNAGIMAPKQRMINSRGWEIQAATNHLGHFLLTALLLPALEAADGEPRVVNVSSVAQLAAPRGILYGPGYFPTHEKYNFATRWEVYGMSKLANIMFTHELQDRLRASGSKVKVCVSHPGWTATELQVGRFPGPTGVLDRALNAIMGMTPRQGALTQIMAAVDPQAVDKGFYGPSECASGSAALRDFITPLNASHCTRHLPDCRRFLTQRPRLPAEWVAWGDAVVLGAPFNPACKDKALTARLWRESEDVLDIKFLSA